MIKMTRKNVSSQPPVIKYPVVMESASRIILFHSKGKGIVLGVTDMSLTPTIDIGKYDCTCDMANFIPYDGEITIQNVR